MTTSLLKIPTESFKRIEIPGNDIAAKMYIAIVNIKNLPKELADWREINPREVNLNSGVSKQIMATLEQAPEDFVWRNRGITIVVNNTEFDNKLNIVRLEFVGKDQHGVLDGGHTLMNIIKFLEDEDDTGNAYVRLEILQGVGDLDETVKIVDARNRSTEVKIANLENLLGHFNSLKAILDSQSYADKIAYKENELAEDGSRKEVPIEDVLSFILCFDAEDFNDAAHPIKAYSGKSSVVKHYRDNVEKMQKYFALAPDILKLRDTIYEDIPTIWNAVGNDEVGGRIGRLRGVKTLRDPRPLPFTGHNIKHVLPAGFIYPMLAAFRALVQIKDGKASWKEDPFRVYEVLKEKFVNKVIETAKRTGNPNEMGKDPNFWGVCYAMVERDVFARKI